MTTVPAPIRSDPFQLPLGLDGTWRHRLLACVRSPVEHLLALPQLNGIYRQLPHPSDPLSFIEQTLTALDVRVDVAW